MAIEFEFRRHSIRDGAANGEMIGPRGYRLGRMVGERQLRGKKFSHFFVSRLYRTHQTLAAFAEGAGDFSLAFAPMLAPPCIVSPDRNELWLACLEAQAKGQGKVESVSYNRAEIDEKIGSLMANLFKVWSDSFADGSRVLVIGHYPAIELLLSGVVTDQKIPSLGSCEGFRIIKKDDDYEVVYGTSEFTTRELMELL